MTQKKLSRSMTIRQFENGYWYTAELKAFAKTIKIPSAGRLRKDELEKAIKFFLRSGKAKTPTKRKLVSTGIKDVERGLRLQLPVVNYTSNKSTKDFIETEARRRVPNLRRKSGACYRLNRWREEQIAKNLKINYRDVVNEYIRLNQSEGSFTQIPHDRYINFISDFLGSEKNPTRAQAIKAWKQLKQMDVPKNYRSWVASKKRRAWE